MPLGPLAPSLGTKIHRFRIAEITSDSYEGNPVLKSICVSAAGLSGNYTQGLLPTISAALNLMPLAPTTLI
jgi:multidrug resistance efflux pump